MFRLDKGNEITVFIFVSTYSNVFYSRSAMVKMIVRMAKMKTDTAMTLAQCFSVLKINIVNTLPIQMELVFAMTGTK